VDAVGIYPQYWSEVFLYNVWLFDADINAAKNIAARGARVTGLEDAPQGSVKAAAL
jgi:hypothetical protein